ncbi:MAG: riboflavin synthase [Pseudomonadota bacterium]
MFTGLITDIGTVQHIEGKEERVIAISSSYDLQDIALGESIACSGTCLTVTSKKDDFLWFDVSAETVAKTNIGFLKKGDQLNLERSLRVGDYMGGHHVSGHVDDVALLESIEKSGMSWILKIIPAKKHLPLLAPKGSVALDGVSLTINNTDSEGFDITIIPHTFEKTIIKNYKAGQKINLEVDTTARYIAHYLDHYMKHSGHMRG